MRKCERCGKSIEGRRVGARFCGLICWLLRKRKEPVYVYAIVWGPNLGNKGIKRYEVHPGLNRDFIRPFSFDFIPLPTAWKPEAFKWRSVGIRHDPVSRAIERKSGYWLAQDAFPLKYYSLEQIEKQWRKLQAEPEIRWESDREPWDEVEPRRRAKELLGVSMNATPADIHRAYRKKALEHHPDHGGDAKIFALVSDAYELLTRTE